MATSRRQSNLVLALIMLAFVAVRGVHLSHVYWIDERFSAVMATQPLSRIPALCARDVNPPLYFVLLRAWNRLGLLLWADACEKDIVVQEYQLEKFTHDGRFTAERPSSGEIVTISGIWDVDWRDYNLAPLWFLRSLSLLAGLASLVLIYRIGVGMFPERRAVALVGAALLSVSAFSIFWDTTMRYYSLSTTLVLVVVWLLVETRERMSLLVYVVLPISLLLSFLTSYVSFYLVPAHVVFVLLLSKRGGARLAFFGGLVVSVVAFALVWGWAIGQQAGLSYSHGIDVSGVGARLARNLFRGLGFYSHLMFSYEPWQSLDAHDTIFFYPLFLIFAALMAAGIWLTLRRGERSDIVMLVYVFAPVIVPVIVNAVSPDTLPFQPRHFYPALPFLALFLARGLTGLIKVKS